MSNYRSEAITPESYAVLTASVTSRIASSVDRPFLLPVCPLGSRPYASTVLVILCPITPSITLPIVLSREISRQPPAVCYYSVVFLGFFRTTTLALRNYYKKYLSSKLACVISARTTVSGLLQAFRKPARRSSLGPGAF